MSALTATICDAVQQLPHTKRAGVLLNTALALIEDGQYGEEVETYFDAYLQTPGLPKEDVVKALLARYNARKSSGEQLLAKARQDLHALRKLDPLNPQIPSQLPCKEIHFSIDPAWKRAPPEIWEQIATHTPRASEDLIFLTTQGTTPLSRGRSSRLHWHWVGEEEETLNILIRGVVKSSLPAFTALRNFECIELLAMPIELIQALFDTHKHLHGLGLIGWGFADVGIPFEKLRKYTLFSDDYVDMEDICTVLHRNERTLKHLTLGGRQTLEVQSEVDFWDLPFKSVTIDNLTDIDLVGMSVSHFALTRIVCTHHLQNLTLQGSFVNPNSATVVFASDRIIDGTHTLMPRLEAFRLILKDPGDALYRSVIHSLREREKLRRLDLGTCPWDIVQDILPDLKNLRVFGVHIHCLSQGEMKTLVESIPKQMVAIKLSFGISDKPFREYARYFTRFNTLSLLSCKPVSKDFIRVQRDTLLGIAGTVPSLDFLAWHNELFVVTSMGLEKVGWKEIENIDVGEDAAWLEKENVRNF